MARPGEKADLPELDEGPDELIDDSGTDEEGEEEMPEEDEEVDLEDHVAAEAAMLVSTPREKKKVKLIHPSFPRNCSRVPRRIQNLRMNQSKQ